MPSDGFFSSLSPHPYSLLFFTIYLDNNATTRPADAVVEAVAGAMRERWGNPSSVHRMGQDARHAVELARSSVAALIGANPKQVTFTSGGTEAIDLVVRGVAGAGKARVVSTRIEHAAVRDLLAALEKQGAVEVAYLDVDRRGRIVAESVERVIAPGTRLVSVQWANNETGTVQDVAAIGARCRAVGAVFHCDGTQWVGKMPTRVDAAGAQRTGLAEPSPVAPGAAAPGAFDGDVLTFSAHKWHGPKGVGVVWSRPGLGLMPRIVGTQEKGRRGGTENAEGIVGASVAAQLAAEWLAEPALRARQGGLRDAFERAVLAGAPGAVVNGASGDERLWNTTNIAFPRLEAEALLMAFSERGLCASAGAACSSGSLDPSPVLLAMGVPAELAHGSVRFSLSRDTTAAEVEEAARIVVEGVRRVGG